MEVRMNNSGGISLSRTTLTVEHKHGNNVITCNTQGQKIVGVVKWYSINVPSESAIKIDVIYEADINYDYDKKQYEIKLIKETQPIITEDKYITHASWGVASLGHVSSGRAKLFGALAYYGNHYALRIHRARITKAEFSHSDRDEIDNFNLPLIEVAFTKEQLLNLLTDMNNASGNTPCTIEFYNNESIKYQREDFNTLEREIANIKAKWESDNSTFNQARQNLLALADQKLTKEVKDEIKKEVEKLNSFVKGTMVYNIEHLVEYIEQLGLRRQVNLPKQNQNPVSIHIAYIKQLRSEFPGLLLADAHETLKMFSDDIHEARKFIEGGIKCGKIVVSASTPTQN